LCQNVEGEEKPIAYASKHLTASERKYTVSEREALAIVWGTKNFKSYFYGQPIVIYTDHKPLCTFKTIKDDASRLNRLMMKLGEVNCEIHYKPGVLNCGPDMLSRITIKTCEFGSVID
jgi:hypothetical protein